MKTRVQKWGNSLALRIPKSFAVEAGLRANAAVELSLVEGRSSCGRSLRNRSRWMNCCAASRTTTSPVSGIRGRLSARRSGEPQRCLYPGTRRCGLDYPRSASGPRASRTSAGLGSVSVGLQRSGWPGSVLPDHQPGEGLPIRGAPACWIAGFGRGWGGPGEEPGLAGAQSGADRCSLGGGRCPSAAATPDVASSSRRSEHKPHAATGPRSHRAGRSGGAPRTSRAGRGAGGGAWRRPRRRRSGGPGGP